MHESDHIIKELLPKYQLVESKLDDEALIALLTQELQPHKVISLIGGAGSGKTTIAARLVKALPATATISTDDYSIGDRAYRRKHFDEAPLEKYNVSLLNDTVHKIRTLTEGVVAVPQYDDATGLAIDGKPYKKNIGPVQHLIVEGDFDFVDQPDIKIYFHVPDAIRLENRVIRDIQKGRECDRAAVEKSFLHRHKTQHLPYTIKAASTADVLIVVSATQQDKGFSYSYSYFTSSA